MVDETGSPPPEDGDTPRTPEQSGEPAAPAAPEPPEAEPTPPDPPSGSGSGLVPLGDVESDEDPLEDEPVDTDTAVRQATVGLAAIRKARKQLFWIKISLPITVIAIVLIGIWVLFDTARTNMVDRKEELFTHFQARAKHFVPRVERQAKESAERVIPQLREQMTRAHEQGQERFQTELQQHTNGLNERLNKRMNTKLDEALDDVAKSQREKLKSTFPKQLKCLPEDTKERCKQKEETLDKIMAEIQKSYRDWAVQEMRTTFDGHLKEMDQIRKTMAVFSAPKEGDGEAPTGASGADAKGDMLLLWLELVAESMGGDGDVFDDPEEQKKKKKSDKKPGKE